MSALRQSISDAGLLLDESRGTYASLNETRPLELALAGARATLGLRLKSLTEQARLDSHGADAASCLNALNTAGVTNRRAVPRTGRPAQTARTVNAPRRSGRTARR